MNQEDQIVEKLIDANDHPSGLNIQTGSNGFSSKNILYSEVHNDNLNNNLRHPVYYNSSKQAFVYVYRQKQ